MIFNSILYMSSLSKKQSTDFALCFEKSFFSIAFLDYIFSTDRSLFMLTLITWFEGELGFPTIKFLFLPPSPYLLFVRKSLCSAHLQGMGSYAPPLWGQNIYTNYFEFFCTGDVSLFPHLFIYLISYISMESWLGI